jgi:hypothetical protein
VNSRMPPYDKNTVVQVFFNPTLNIAYMTYVSQQVAAIAQSMFLAVVGAAIKADGLPNDPDGVSMTIAGITFDSKTEHKEGIDYLRHNVYKRNELVATVSVEPPTTSKQAYIAVVLEYKDGR